VVVAVVVVVAVEVVVVSSVADVVVRATVEVVSMVEVDELADGTVVVVVEDASDDDSHPATARARTPMAATNRSVTRPASSSK
jgi:hypothetical protein